MNQQELESQGLPNVSTYSGSVGYMDQASSDIIREFLNPSDVLNQIEHQLRGEKWNPKTQEYETKKRVALANEDGINTLMTVLEPRVSRMFTLSNFFDEDRINRVMINFSNSVARLLAHKYRAFGMARDMRDIVHDIIVDSVEASMLRAYKAGEKTFLRGTMERKEVYSNVPSKRGGLLNI